MATWCSLKLVCSQTYHMTWTQQQCHSHSQFIMVLHQHEDQPLIHSTISPQVLQNYTLETCWMGTFKASSVLKRLSTWAPSMSQSNMYDKAKKHHGQYDFWLCTSVTIPIPSTDLNQLFAMSVNNIVMVHQMLWVKFEVYKNLIFLAEAFYFRVEYQVSRIDKKSFW